MLTLAGVAALHRLDLEVRTALRAFLAELALTRIARAATVRFEELPE